MEASPDNPLIYSLLGRVSMSSGNLTQAEMYFNKSLDLDPNLLASYMALGQLSLRRESPQKAVARVEKALEVNSELVMAHMLIGIIDEGQKKYEKAQARYERILEINPEFGPAANNLAWLYTERGGNIDVALGLAETARAQLPEDPNVADTLGWLYYKKNAYLKAISALKEAAEKMDDNSVVQYHLGMAYAKNGDTDLAKAALQRALSLNETFEGAEEAKTVLADL